MPANDRLHRIRRTFLSGLVITTVGVILTPAPADAVTGGGTIVAPAARHVVPMGSIEVHVRVGAGLVGKRAGIMTVPGWALRLFGQPRNPGNYRLFTIRSRTFVIDAPAPFRPGRYTIRIDRDFPNGDHGGIAQVHVTYRRFTISRLSATPGTFYPLVRDGYRDTTRIKWYRNVPADSESMTVRNHGTIQFRGGGPAGTWYFKWNGVIGGDRLRPGQYFVRINATELGRTAHSVWRRVIVATKTVRVSRTVGKQGTGWASRGWSRTQSGGSCNWDSYSGQLLTTCLYAVSRTSYKFFLPKGAIADHANARYRRGIVPCHPVLRAGQVGNVATVIFYSDGSNGWSQCWIVQVRVTFHYMKTYVRPDRIETRLIRVHPAGSGTGEAASRAISMISQGRTSA
jgi:hypothetical protein